MKDVFSHLSATPDVVFKAVYFRCDTDGLVISDALLRLTVRTSAIRLLLFLMPKCWEDN